MGGPLRDATKKLFWSMLAYLLAVSPAAADEVRTLGLGQALDELDAHNLGLAEARTRVEQARAVIGQASAALLPSVVAAGGYVRNSDEAKLGLASIFQTFGRETPAGIPGTLYIQPIGAWTVSGQVKVPLLIPTAWADRAAALRGAESAAASVAAMRLQLRGARRDGDGVLRRIFL